MKLLAPPEKAVQILKPRRFFDQVQVLLLSLLVGLLVFHFSVGNSASYSIADYNNWFLSGFYGPEKNSEFSYRWTRKEAKIIIPQTSFENRLTLRLLALSANPAADTEITLKINRQVAQICKVQPDGKLHSCTLNWQATTNLPTADLFLDVSQVYQAPGDKRELGVIITDLNIENQYGPGPVRWPSPFVLLALFSLMVVVNGILLLFLPGGSNRLWQYSLGIILPSVLLYFGVFWVVIPLFLGAIFWLLFRSRRSNPAHQVSFFIPALLFSAMFLFYSITSSNQLAGSNDGSTFALVKAIVDSGDFKVNPFTDYTWMIDIASPSPDQYFSDRPPGTAWLAVAFYWPGKILSSTGLLSSQLPLFQLFNPPQVSLWDGFNWVILLPAICGALAVVVLYKLTKYLGASTPAAIITAGFFGQGTLAAKYSTLLYSHLPGILCLLAGFYLVLTARRKLTRLVPGYLALGYAITIDYSNILPVAAILLYFLLRKSGNLWERLDENKLAIISLGVVAFTLPLIALGIYHTICFGSPLNTSYTYDVQWLWARSVFTTFNLPPGKGLGSLLVDWGNLFDFSALDRMRGLLLLSPVLAFSLCGIPALWQKNRALVVLIAATVIPTVLLISSHHTFWGGGDQDPRYLLITIPFLLLPLPFWLDGFVFKRNGFARPGWLLLLGLLFVYCFTANILHLYLDYPFRLLQWTGLVKIHDWGATGLNSSLPIQPFNFQNLPLALLVLLIILVGAKLAALKQN